MSIHVLENEKLKVTISDKGAELISVTEKASGRERLGQADPAIWNRHAPILFPFVGKVVDGKYRINGREYEMKTQQMLLTQISSQSWSIEFAFSTSLLSRAAGLS